MRGAGDGLSVGERIRFYRRRRRLTKGVLANLVGLSEDWLSKIERGERDIKRELEVWERKRGRSTRACAPCEDKHDRASIALTTGLFWDGWSTVEPVNGMTATQYVQLFDQSRDLDWSTRGD